MRGNIKTNIKETIGKRIEDKIDVEYVFQKLDDLPDGYNCPNDRFAFRYHL